MAHKLKKLLKKWQKRCLLQRWNITIMSQPEEDWDKNGLCVIVPGSERASVLVSKYPESDMGIEHIVLHELTHLMLVPLDEVKDTWKPALDESQRELFDRQFTLAMEKVVDHVSRALLNP
jgi:hypothetical protein